MLLKARNWLIHLPHFFILLLLIAALLRFINLGYSDFQGDEIKALFMPDYGVTVSEFLLTQRKGPVQFLITYVLGLVNPGYTNQLLIRLPFAIAGFLSVYFFYKFIKQNFNSRIALYSAFFLATNGFFVAFSRLVQYQSYVILFMILSLFAFSLSVKDEKWRLKGVYLGFIFWAISILSHYDGIFIFPFVLYFLVHWIAKVTFDIKKILRFPKHILLVKHMFYGFCVFLLLLGIFYIPFITSIDPATKSYWQGRLSGTGGKISSSMYLFTVYQPIYVIHIYFALFFFGVVGAIKSLTGTLILDGIIKARFNSLGAILLLIFNTRFQKVVALFFWFLIPFLFMEVLVNIPGTHIYTYLVPLFIFMGFGVDLITDLVKITLKKFAPIVSVLGIASVFAFIFLQSYFVFVDNAYEYPWEGEKFLIWEFPQPTPIYHLSMFGFPYNRNWEGIGSFVNGEDPTIPCPKNLEYTECPFRVSKIRFYSTNERSSISRYHIPFTKDTDNAGYYIYIKNPQSFTNEILSEKANYWASNYAPTVEFGKCHIDTTYRKVLEKMGKEINCEYSTMSAIYYMPRGDLDFVKNQGF